MSLDQEPVDSSSPVQEEGGPVRDHVESTDDGQDSSPAPLEGPLPDFNLSNRTNQRRSASTGLLNIVSSHFGFGGRPPTPTTPTRRTSKPNKLSKLSSRPDSIRSTNSDETEDPDAHLDPLPNAKIDLEVRLNYHLSELDRFHKCVCLFNTMILDHEEKYRNIHDRAQIFNMPMQQSVQQLAKIGVETMRMRKGNEKYIAYHRHEVDRIVKRMIQVKEQSGEEARLPEVIKNLRTEAQWAELFSVGGRIGASSDYGR